VHHWQHFARTCDEEEKYEETNHVNTIDDKKVENQVLTASKMLVRKLDIDIPRGQTHWIKYSTWCYKKKKKKMRLISLRTLKFIAA